MADLQQLIRKAQVQGRIPSPERALRWMRATTSMLADWGGSTARSLLADALPADLLKGGGSSGRPWDKALAAEVDETLVLHCEAARRACEQDPGKVSWSLTACLSLIRESLGEDAAGRLASSLPGPVGKTFSEARWSAPWRYRLVPQPFGAGRRRQRELRTGSAHAE
jgi:uncharacterized protein (DUF2267 family)